MIIHSALLAIELLIYFFIAITIGLHLKEHHEWYMPFIPIIKIWNHLKSKDVYLIGIILAEIFAVFFTARFAIIGFIGLGVFYIHKGFVKAFYYIFTKR